ncbi:MAG: hypothetical protein QMD01_00415 [Thermodesulfovibrionales bacterium]|nr:hypothetical protein [Thermodesulfovibrionales bacterium]
MEDRDVKYRSYTPEEDKLHEDAIAKIKNALSNGLSFAEACSVVDIQDEELKRFVADDALKIMIAEMHFAKGMALQQVSDALKVPIKLINIAKMEMLEDAGITAAEAYKRGNPDNPLKEDA